MNSNADYTIANNTKYINMAESITSKTSDKTANIDLIIDYVVKHKYPEGASKNNKADMRTLSATYLAYSGQLYYSHKPDTASDDMAEQQRIVPSVHMGSSYRDTARSTGGHIRIHHTRAIIPEQSGCTAREGVCFEMRPL